MVEQEPTPAPLAIIVEDEGAIRMLLAEILAEEGYAVAAYADIHAAITALTMMQPALVVTDLGFPGSHDGWDVVRRMRTDPRLEHVPVVICTATLFTDTYRTMTEHLCAYWLAKPFTIDALLNSVDRAQHMMSRPDQ